MRLFHKLHDHHHCERRFARHPDGMREGRRHGPGGRLARFLEHGDLKMLVLHLIAEKPRHGYEIIKAIEDLAGGGYAPSPGVVYPTLTLLEDLGHVTATVEGSRKSYAITPEGQVALAENQAAVNALLARIAASQPRDSAMPVFRAMENVKTALRMKLGARTTAPDIIRKIADALDDLARKIEEF